MFKMEITKFDHKNSVENKSLHRALQDALSVFSFILTKKGWDKQPSLSLDSEEFWHELFELYPTWMKLPTFSLIHKIATQKPAEINENSAVDLGDYLGQYYGKMILKVLNKIKRNKSSLIRVDQLLLNIDDKLRFLRPSILRVINEGINTAKSDIPALIISAFLLLICIDEGFEAGLLRFKSTEELTEITGFRHQRIKEYLAARYLNMTGQRINQFMNLWWKQTIFIYGTITNNPSDMLAQIMKNDSDNMDCFFAADVACFSLDSKQKSFDITPLISELLKLLKASNSYFTQYQAINALSKLAVRRLWNPNPEDIQKLIDKTRDISVSKALFDMFITFDKIGYLNAQMRINILRQGFKTIINTEF